MMRSLPSGVRTTTDMMRRWKSNGISSTFAELRDAGVRVALLVREHRAVEDVLEAGLEVAVDVGEGEHAVVFAQRDVAVLLQDDLVHRERAGLVGAQHVHRAEVLDRVDAA